jgi:hypothetical protein
MEQMDSAGNLVGAIRRSDHSVLYQLQPSSAPPVRRVALGQQKGSKRSKSSLCNLVQISRQRPQSRMNRAIARQSSPIVVFVEHACHAGGRGFESRRSRKIPANWYLVLSLQAQTTAGFDRSRADPARQSPMIAGRSR